MRDLGIKTDPTTPTPTTTTTITLITTTHLLRIVILVKPTTTTQIAFPNHTRVGVRRVEFMDIVPNTAPIFA